MSKERQYSAKKPLVLVGLMGAGKTTVGRRLAARLHLPFVDSDDEIAAAADLSVSEIFNKFGEQYFRDGEERVMERLLDADPCVLSTGGGAFLSSITRERIAEKGISIWLKADLETLWDRVSGKAGRPLLLAENPKQTLNDLLIQRYPVYQLAEITVKSKLGNPHEQVVDDIVNALMRKYNYAS